MPKGEKRLIAIQNKILVKMDEMPREQLSKGGIVMADVSKKEPRWGTVVAVGEGKPVGVGREFADDGMRQPDAVIYHRPAVLVGDRVYVEDFHGGKVEFEGEEYLCCDEDDVLAVVRG